MGLLCYFCQHPLTNLPHMTEMHCYGDVQCAICKAVFHLSMTIRHAPERKGEELAARQNKAVG